MGSMCGVVFSVGISKKNVGDPLWEVRYNLFHVTFGVGLWLFQLLINSKRKIENSVVDVVL
jgi:hypothetical protein